MARVTIADLDALDTPPLAPRPPRRGLTVADLDALDADAPLEPSPPVAAPGAPTGDGQPFGREVFNALMRGLIDVPKTIATVVEAAPTATRRAVTAIGQAQRVPGVEALVRPPAPAMAERPAEAAESAKPAPAAEAPSGPSVGEHIEALGRRARRFYGRLQEQFPQGEDIQGNVIDRPELLLNPKWLVSSIVQTVPSLAVSLVAGAGGAAGLRVGGEVLKLTPQLIMRLARIGALASGGTVGGLMEGANTYEEVLRRGGTQEEATKALLVMTAAAAGLNAFSLSKIIPGGSQAGGLVRRGVVAGGTEAVTEGAEEVVEGTILGDPLSESLKQAATVAIPAGILGAAAGTAGAVSERRLRRQVPRATPPPPGSPRPDTAPEVQGRPRIDEPAPAPVVVPGAPTSPEATPARPAAVAETGAPAPAERVTPTPLEPPPLAPPVTVENLDALDRPPAPVTPAVTPAEPTPTVPERPETVARQIEAFDRGDKPAVLLSLGAELPDVAGDLNVEILDTEKGTLLYRPEAVADLAQDLPGDTLEDKLRWAIENNKEGLILGYGVETKPAPGEPAALVETRGPAGEEVQTIVAPTPVPPEVLESAERVKPPEGGEVVVTPPEEAEGRAAEVVRDRLRRGKPTQQVPEGVGGVPGFTRTGMFEPGTVPREGRPAYHPNGLGGRIVGEDAESYYLTRAAGSMVAVHKYPKADLDAAQRRFAEGAEVMALDKPAVVVQPPVWDNGFQMVRVRFEDGTEMKVRAGAITDRVPPPAGPSRAGSETERGPAEGVAPAPPVPPPPTFTARLFQGRAATPEQVYGKANVQAGRGHPLVGPGHYYTFTKKDAERYGEVSEHEIALRKPYVLTSDRQWFGLLEAAKAGQLSSVDRDQGPSGPASQRLQDYLVAQGHDGLIVRFPRAYEGDVGETGQSIKRVRESFGSSQVVVFGRSSPGPSALENQGSVPVQPETPQPINLNALGPSTRAAEVQGRKPGMAVEFRGEVWTYETDGTDTWRHGNESLSTKALVSHFRSLDERSTEEQPKPPTPGPQELPVGARVDTPEGPGTVVDYTIEATSTGAQRTISYGVDLDDGRTVDISSGELTTGETPAPGGTIEPSEEGGERRGRRGRVREPRAPDQGPLAEVPPEDVPRTGEGGRPGPERGRGGAPDVGRDVRTGGGEEAPVRPGMGAGEGGVGVPPERGGQPEPAVRPERPARAREPDERPTFHDYRITDSGRIGQGSPREKARANVEAIRLLKQLEEAGRPPTPDEQAALAQYVGWGGMPQPFAPYNVPREWQGVQEDLEGLLTPEEFASARASTPNAHFTPPLVVEGMWRAVERLGLGDGALVLEPAMGVGHFFGLMPESLLPGARRSGIELDSITGRIAKVLYPKAHIQVAGFEAVRIPDDFFDLAISNVPFGNYGVHDARYRKTPFLLRSIHDYFFAKALDKVRPGGGVAFITTSYTMDKADPAVRTYLAERANLLGAIRLPNTAFKGIAGTEVTTDILFLQKRAKGAEATGAAWTDTKEVAGKGGVRVTVNEYYARHPEMMLGQMSREGTMYRADEQALVGKLTREALDAAVARLPAEAITPRLEAPGPELVSAYNIPDATTMKDGGYAVDKDGRLVVRQGDRVTVANVSASDAARVTGMLRVRNAARDVLRTQLAGETDEAIVQARTRLNTEYDGFVRRHGPLNDKANRRAFEGDPDAPLLVSLEDYDPETRKATKRDIFTKRTVARYEPPATAGTAEAALTVSMAERGRIDWIRMQELTGKTPSELQAELGDLVFKNPDEGGRWETADEYLTGQVRDKLKLAEATAGHDPAYRRNAEALRKVQPPDLEPGDIDARLGAGWIPTADVEAFAREVLEVRANVRYAEVLATWSVEPRGSMGQDTVANTETWGTRRFSGHALLRDALNLKTPTVYDKDEHGVAFVNQEETIAAREKQQNLKDEFRRWVWQDGERATRLAQRYNDEYNGIRLRQYDGGHLTLPGSNPAITLHPHQKNAIWRILQSGNTLLAHVVGAGKTFEMIGAAMEAKRMGLIKKPLFVVPNHMPQQFANDFLQLYPGANILVAGEKDLGKGHRQRFMARVAAGTFDGVIVTHQQFGALPVSDETFNAFSLEQMNELAATMVEVARAEGKNSRIVKELEKTMRRLRARLERRAKGERKDITLTFEELGVDWMAVDEAHKFKNLFYTTKMQRVAGLPTSDSDRANDMFVKVRYLSDLTGGRGVVFATGTPVSNTMAEMYTLSRYLQFPLLKERGLATFDAWAANFGETVTSWETSVTGAGYKPRTRFARFVNLPELLNIFRLVADVQTADMLKLPTPTVAGGKPTPVVGTGHPSLKAFVQSLEARAKQLGPPRKGADNMLKITVDGRKAALDFRLVVPEAGDVPNGKINKAVENVHRLWQSTKKARLTQLVFIDFSTPAAPADRGKVFTVYDDVKAKLLRLGIPKEEIAFIHDSPGKADQQRLFDAVNAGRVRILLGSTEKMGVGTNVQKRLIALHHLDAPWKPAEIEQREGRILRQGNDNAEVSIYRYTTEGSFDTYMWQTLEVKARFIAQVMRGDVSVRTAEDIDGAALTFAEMKALSSGNPMIAEKVKVDAEVRRLDALHAHHKSARVKMRMDIATLPARIAAVRKHAANIKADLEQRDRAKAETPEFAITISGTAYRGKGAREEAGKALAKAIEGRFGQPEPVSVGTYLGFELEVHGYPNTVIVPTLYVVGRAKHTATVNMDNPTGTINSVESLLTHLDGREAEARGQVAALEKKLVEYKAEVDKPFEHEAALKSLVERQQQLQDALDLTKSDQQAASVDPAEVEEDARVDEDAEEDVSDRAPSNAADDVSQENLREVREEKRKEAEAGRVTVGGLAGPLGLLFRGRRGAEPPGAPPTVETPGPEGPRPRGGRFRGHEGTPESEVERALTATATRGMPGLGERFRTAYQAVRRATTFEWDLRAFPLERDEIRVFLSERRKAFTKAGEDVVGIIGRLADQRELEHFTRIVLLRDYRARALMPERFPGGVPEGLSVPRIEAELERLEESAPPRVRAALDAHARLMDAERADLEARGLLDPDRAIPDYFPHLILDFAGNGPDLPGTRKIKRPFRRFLQRARGSARLPETDYLSVLFRHRAEVRMANAIDDFALGILERHDRSGQLPKGQQVHPGQRLEIEGEEYQAIQYRPGRTVFPVRTIAEDAIARALEAGETTLEIDLDDVRRAGALGRYFKVYVVPAPIAERFEHFAPEAVADGLRLLNEATSRWKAVTIGFWGQAGNLLNLLGDIMNLARTPGALVQLPAAARDVARWMRGTGGDLVQLMERYDVLSSGYVANEVYFRAKAPELRQFLTQAESSKQRVLDVVRFYFRTIPEFREAVPRVAMARYQFRRLRRGQPLRPGPVDIAGLEGERAAAKIAREFTVDYGKFTEFENRILRGLLLPFYSWTRQNTPNWLRFLWMSRIGLTAFLGLRLLLELWNNDDDERQIVERSLPTYKRNTAHIVTNYRDAKGRLIVVFWAGDPMADALGMVGLAGTPARLSDLATERISLDQAARDQLWAFVREPGQRVTGLLTPFVKVPIEIVTGKSALTGGDISPKEFRGTAEERYRLLRHAGESAFRPLREARQFRIQAGKQEGLDLLTHRFGLGLPFERVDVGEAAERVALDRWYEGMAQAAEQRMREVRNEPGFVQHPPHVQELDLREAADQARREYVRRDRRPVSVREQRRRIRER